MSWMLACHATMAPGPEVPTGPEICNGVDDDGDGLVDADDPDVESWAFVDEDGDGYGARAVPSCGDDGTTLRGGDCDDADPSTFPGAPERCNFRDDDCDQLVDDDDPSLVDRAYPDLDGDGWGTGVGEPRCPVEGEARQPGDCNDFSATTFPGAPELCDGIADNDCDGIDDPAELDADGDGDGLCSDCDDADPTRSGIAEERCSGIDDDCDGLVDLDDPSVNPYTCDVLCGDEPLEDLLADAVLERTYYNPCLLDPRTVGLCDPDGNDLPDGGRRLHRIVQRTDLEHHRRPLFLFLPPGPGYQNVKVLDWAALEGFRTLSVSYVNDEDMERTCNGLEDGCFSDWREETIYGRDVSPFLTIDEPDSLVTRLRVVLEVLAADDPAGWGHYLDSDGDIAWSEILVSGWSVGAGNAAMLAKHHEVHGVMLLSGPKDRIYDPHPVPSSWIRGPQVTDGCRFAGVFHEDEHFTADVGGETDVLSLSWGSLGVPESHWFDDGGDTTDFGQARLVLTQHPNPDCRPHAIPGRDDCMEDRLFPAYRRMMCDVANHTVGGETCDPAP